MVNTRFRVKFPPVKTQENATKGSAVRHDIPRG